MRLRQVLRAAFLSGDHFGREGSTLRFGFDPTAPRTPPLDVEETVIAMIQAYGPEIIGGEDWKLIPPDREALVAEIRRRRRSGSG